MKQTILSIVITLLTSVSTNAQCYIGGSLSLNMSSEKIQDLDNSTNPSYSFSISPEIGYSLNDKIDIGLSLSTLFSSFKQSNIRVDIENNLRVGGIAEDKTKSIEFAPYIRYSFLKWGKLDVIGMLDVYMSTGKTEYTSNYEYEYGNGYEYSENKSRIKTAIWGTRIRPVFRYNLSDKISLLAHLNLFRLGFSQGKYKIMYNLTGDEYTKIRTGFDFKIDTNNPFPAIGFVYKI